LIANRRQIFFMTSREHPLMQSASQVAATFFAALHGEMWEAAASLVDEQARAEFHEAEVADLLARAQKRAAFRTMRDGASEGVGYSPDSSSNAALLGEFGKMPVLGLEGVTTIGDYAALPAIELLARHLEAGNGRISRFPPSMLARIRAHLAPGADLGAALPPNVRGADREVIGEVLETVGADRIAHVVYRRMRSAAGEIEDRDRAAPREVDVLHLRDRDGWRVIVTQRDNNLFGMSWFEPDYDWEPRG
jgi:hypothetical protein